MSNILMSNGSTNGSPSAVIPRPSKPTKRTDVQLGDIEFPWLLGKSPELLKAVRAVRSAARSECHVLLTGETGTGKELLARALHESSGRRGKLVAINIAAIPDGLVESELFGHVRGAFTGASVARGGCFVEAADGTLLLDEIGELDLASQAKLLRVLEESSVRPVGDDHTTATNARVIAATSRNLERLVSDGRFREDLYYRLNVVRIQSPALRDRRADVSLLASHFLLLACQRHGKDELTIDPSLMHWLEDYTWPGNVRQLRHLIESMVVLSEGPVLSIKELPSELPEQNMDPSQNLWHEGTLREIEDHLILERLQQYNGSKTAAARSLGISVRTIQRRIAELDARQSQAPRVPREEEST